MFTDIEQLEKEIQTFRKNVIASNDLVRAIEGLLKAVEVHTENHQTATEQLKEKMESHTASLKSLTRLAAEDMEEKCRQNGEALLKIAKATLSEGGEQNKILLEQSAKQFELALRGYISTLETTQATLIQAKEAYISQQKEVQAALKQTETGLCTTYAAFLERLEKTNVDQMFQTCKEMKKSLELKLWIVAGGVGLSVLLTVISLFIK